LPWKLTVPYWIAQLVGGVAAGGVLLAIASGRPGYSLAENGLATNGYGELSPAGYSMGAVFLTEALLTAVFLYIILGAT
ncbi:aquaporin Z, partial [Xanthomonas citri pv. citri]|nr:aquaporin Z [Xanthomonas citri pv. citri]